MILTRHSIRSRRRSRAGLVLAVVLGLSLGSRPAGADVEEAKLHFQKAETAYKLGHFLEAIREYDAAYRAMPDAAFLFNIAQSQRQQYYQDKKVERLHKALSLYKSYLREMPKAPNRETVRKIIEELQSLAAAMEQRAHDQGEKKPARLMVRGESADGGQITLDGKLIGTVPLSHNVNEPGTHLVKVTKAGFRPYSTSITLSAGSQLELPVVLQPVGGRRQADTPVYKTWWFWTIVGVAVAGGTGAGIYFATRGDDIPSMPEIDLR
jgi:hypothetical protein